MHFWSPKVFEGYNWIWSFEWRRAMRPQDLAEKLNLDLVSKQVCPAHELGDKLFWAFDKSGYFTTKSCTFELNKLSPPFHHDAVKGLWKGVIPHRIEVFVWTALLRKINTRHKLASIGIISSEEDLSAPYVQQVRNQVITSSFTAYSLKSYGLGGWICGIQSGSFQKASKKHSNSGVAPKNFLFSKRFKLPLILS